MYIIELISKLIKKNKEKEQPTAPLFYSDEQIEEQEESCEHIFIPIDSTKETLACSKCGYIHKITNHPKKNFFIK